MVNKGYNTKVLTKAHINLSPCCIFSAEMAERQVLPDWVVPRHYSLSIYSLDLSDKFTFAGSVSIQLDVAKTTDSIVINSHELELKQATVVFKIGKSETSLEATSISYDEQAQTATIKFPNAIPTEAGTASLLVHYTGLLNNKMCGLYRSKYTDGESKAEKYMFSTQFESTDARRAFPCFDEPALKATFDFQLTLPKNWTAISNMNVISSKAPDDGKKKGPNTVKQEYKTVEFATTPIMSTYLLGWAFGDFEYIEAFTEKSYSGRKLPVRVYTTRGLSSQGQLALNVAAKVIDYFSEIFKVDYPLPKADLVAVHEFSHGAMENWGMTTYRTTALLFDAEKSDAVYKKRVAYVVSHELAHQWFGDLVTMQWWNDLWLNEGFATWVGWLAVDHLYPEWDVFGQFVSDSLQNGMALDSLRESHPIEVQVNSALEIEQIFDAISYLKGASCIRMLSSYLGIDIFLSGVALYLKKHAYKNATTLDLWAAISEVSGVDVGKIMNPWITKVGYPLVTVSEESDGKITVRQQRFLSSDDVSAQEDKTVWWIPLNIAVSSASGNKKVETYDKVRYLSEKQLDISGLGQFYKLNKDTIGIYRVSYPQSRLQKLAANLDGLSVSDKIGLIADAGAVAPTRSGSTPALLDLIRGFRNEQDFSVWSEIRSQLYALKSVWYEQPETIQRGLDKFIIELTTPTLEKLGWEFKSDESYLISQLRTLIIQLAGVARHPAVLQQVEKLFKEYVAGNTKAIHPNLRRAVFSIALANGQDDKAGYDAVYNLLIHPDSVDSKEVALVALGKVTRPEAINRTEELLLSPGDAVPLQNMPHLIVGLVDNPKVRNQYWDFVKSHWKFIEIGLGGNVSILNHFIKLSLNRFSSRKLLGDINNFFKDKNTTAYDRVLNEAVSSINVAANWVEKDSEPVHKWLHNNGYISL